MLDILIKNGLIYDGLGNEPYVGDIAVKNGTIVEINKNIDAKATTVIDAQGNAICPGFIDPHVHEELTVLEDGKFELFLRQGVTSIINANCGHSITPTTEKNVLEYMFNNGLISEKAVRRLEQDDECKWNDLKEYIGVVKKKGTNINMGFLLGHGTIRWITMNGSHDRKPTEDEMKTMKEYIEEGMQQGALGLSTGLSYIPGKFATKEEIIELAKVVSKYNGIYATHARYHIGMLESTQEAIEIGEEANISVQISHLSTTSPESFDEVIKARQKGVEVCIDTIPKSSGHLKRIDRMLLSISAQSPELFGLGIGAVKEALKTPPGRSVALKAIRFKDSLSVVRTNNAEIEGKTIIEIAEEKGMEPDDVLVDFLINKDGDFTFWQGGLNREDFSGKTYLANIANNPYLMVGSDHIMGEVNDPFVWYELFRSGAFPLFFKQLKASGISLEEIIRRVTSLPAKHFRLKKRGKLMVGNVADITIIDFDNYTYPNEKEIDYNKPLTYAKGVEWVIVNGEVVLNGKQIFLRKTGKILSLNGKGL